MNRSIDVDKSVLLQKLKENRDLHAAEYEELFKAYQKDVIKGLQRLLKNAKAGNIQTALQVTKPQNYTSSYDEIIGMLEMSITDVLTISQDEYRKYVLNQWEWSGMFNTMKSMYLN